MATTFYIPPRSEYDTFQVYDGPAKPKIVWALFVHGEYHTFTRDDAGNFSEPKIFRRPGAVICQTWVA